MKEETEDDFITEAEQECKIEYQKLKLKLDNLQNSKGWKSLVVGMIFVFIAVAVEVIFLKMHGAHDLYLYVCTGVMAVLMGAVVACAMFLYLETLESGTYAKILEYEKKDMQEKIQDDVFENSIKMTYKYLDQYYLQTREHAQKGFFITVCVSIFGAVLIGIGIGIVGMFLEKTSPSYVTCASGVITEFIATIFFFMYNKTVMSMSKYHNKLVLSHNISIALKVADTLPKKDKIKSKNLIILELLKDMNTHLIKSDSEDTKN